ncbi:glycosyltransferase [Candidatus Woesearchaeota archaeon]|nr:glycosyltransferase [Candidatus Woesearchaeota archaeon]
MRKKPKILHLITGLDIGGAERFLLNLLPELAKDFDVQIAYLKGKGTLVDAFQKRGICVTHIPMRAMVDPLCLVNLITFLNKEKPDILHMHLFRAELYGTIAGKITGVPVFVSSKHSENPYTRHPIIRFIEQQIASTVDITLCVSKTVHDYYTSLGFNPSSFRVIENTIPDRYNPISSKKKKSFVIGTVGRLVYAKGYDILLRALPLVVHKFPYVRCVLVGDGDKKESLTMLTKQLKVEEHVSFVGMQEDPLPFLQSFDVFVFPSRYEGFGLSLVEAMSQKKAIVASAISTTKWMLEDGVSGLLFDSEDVESLASQLIRLLQSTRLRQAIGKSARQHYLNDFSFDGLVRNYLSFYRAFMKRSDVP